MIHRKEVQLDAPRFSWLSSFLPVLLFLIAAGLTIWFLVRLFSQSEIESRMGHKNPFGIFISLTAGSGDKDLKYFGILAVYPETRRLGIVSLFPETIMREGEKTIAERVTSSSPDEVIKEMEKLLSLDIPYRISGNGEHIIRLTDLVQGIPFFLYGPDLLPGEAFPTGEFVMDGSIVLPWLFPTHQTESSPAVQLFRHYSYGLNLWQHRAEKWKLLNNKEVMSLMLSGTDGNLQTRDLLSLGNAFVSQDWIPLFLEVPVKRSGNSFITDHDSFALFWKNFEEQLTAPENPFLEIPPKMEVKNGTMVAGLARTMRQKIYREGIEVLEFANADHNNYKYTVLLDTNAHSYYLNTIGKMLGIKRLYHTVNRSLFTDSVLILGENYQTIGTTE